MYEEPFAGIYTAIPGVKLCVNDFKTVANSLLLLKVVIIPLLLTFALISTLPLLWEVKEILLPATKVDCELSIKSIKLDSVGKSPVLK